MPDLIAFLTDYGTRDGFAAVCHGVAATRAPAARVLDVTHDVPPQDVRHGSVVLARVARHLPPAVYVAVVDPGVGTARRGLALRAGTSMLVGPDNGLLPPAADVLGGVTDAYALTNPALWLPEVERTFHGRDVFMPVGAFLAGGGPLGEVGDQVDAGSLVRLPAPARTRTAASLTAEVTYVDHYGNVQVAGDEADLALLADWAVQGWVDVVAAAPVRTVQTGEAAGAGQAGEPGGVRDRARVGRAFGDVPAGELLAYLDSDRRLALAVNEGSAAARLRVRGGSLVTVAAPAGG
ncbi:SAM-dependent chlorinase/fluorinase [Actinopolymorpha sp. NPDC004070]|uniref:SAM hydrolase/SAM-dependent halogenase family protein n=1 Tax=Actinopolymorpha sp. NPDC004070 TaxID=3154548 RepID=UPI0033B85C64